MKTKTKKLELNKYFEKIYSSASLGMIKPNREIFDYVISDLAVNPNEIIFVDDKNENIVAAENLGIKGIVFENFNKLKNDLMSFGIKF